MSLDGFQRIIDSGLSLDWIIATNGAHRVRNTGLRMLLQRVPGSWFSEYG